MKRRTRIGVAIAVLVLAVLGGGYSYLVTHTFSARAKPSSLEAFVARNVRRLATPPAVRRLKSTVPSSPLAIAEGRDHFADHCAFCHANDGSGKTEANEGLYPPAPDLREDGTQGLTDGELFSIIQDGVRFTGMPGWGGEPEENWKLVLFIRHLPRLSSEEIELMKETNDEGGQRHHE